MDLSTLTNKDCLITGGLGFIGSNLARKLVELGARVTLVDSLIPEYGGNLFNIAGIAQARKEWFFYTDGDAQYDARELKRLAEKISAEVDFINGYKIKRRDPLIRIVIGILYQYFIKLLFGLQIRDVDCDFRLMRRAIFDVVELESNTGTITFELVKKAQDAGYRFVEVPVHHFYRQYGESQFFNLPRVARTLFALTGWWWRLVVKQEAVKAYREKREKQVAGRVVATD